MASAQHTLKGVVGQALRALRADLGPFQRAVNALETLFFNPVENVPHNTGFTYEGLPVYQLRATGVHPSNPTTSAVLDTGAVHPLMVFGWLYDGTDYQAWPFNNVAKIKVTPVGDVTLFNTGTTLDGELYDINIWYTKSL